MAGGGIDDPYEQFSRHAKDIAMSTASPMINQDGTEENFLEVSFKDSDIITIADVVEAAAGKNPDYCTQTDKNGAIPLHAAALAGDIKSVIFFVNVLPESILYTTNENVLPLHLAAFGGHQRVCEELLRRDPSTAAAVTQHGLRAQDIARHFEKANILESLASVAPEYYTEETGDAETKECGEDNNKHAADEGTSATATLPAKQEVHIPTITSFPALAADLFDDSVVDATLTTTLDVSQLLLNEFHTASLLEDENETEIIIPDLNTVNYEKHTRMTPYRGADRVQGSEMFNLSDELQPAQPHRRGLAQSNRPRNTVPPLTLLGVKAVRSPFLFDKPTARQALSRPNTGKAPGSAVQRPATSGASGKRPGTRSARSRNNNHRQQQEEPTRPAAATAPQLQLPTTVQVVHEVSVPALIITTAAVQRTSPSAKNRKHRPYNRQNDEEAKQPTSSAEPVAPEETVRMYALHRPLSTPQSPAARTVPKSHRTVVNQAAKNQENPAPPQSPVAATDPAHPTSSHMHLTPETRRIEGKNSPSLQQPPSPPQQPTQETTAVVEAKEKTLTARSHVHKVTIAQEFPAGSLPGLPLSPSGFAPSRALRPSKILCAAMLTPAERQKLDLAHMAHEAQRICQDPEFVPTVRPVHNAGSASHKSVRDSGADTAQAAPTRAQRYEMLRDYSHRDPATPSRQHGNSRGGPRASERTQIRPAETTS